MMTIETLKNFFATHIGDNVWMVLDGDGGAGPSLPEITEDMSAYIEDLDGWRVTDNKVPSEEFEGVVEDIEQYTVIEFANPYRPQSIQFLLWDVD